MHRISTKQDVCLECNYKRKKTGYEYCDECYEILTSPNRICKTCSKEFDVSCEPNDRDRMLSFLCNDCIDKKRTTQKRKYEDDFVDYVNNRKVSNLKTELSRVSHEKKILMKSLNDDPDAFVNNYYDMYQQIMKL